ncbi:MAG: acetyl-CoA carboxylase, biotin carboxyl carrier protein [Alphaproteobacteria bacterium RIFCSPHIGHO2_12_FULL_63_12]|nr:MAG: acetyl-CoA carboxylase, biotin carboxyl carrier protein [Alphaproteobacteria bacterium RIFCSPHIGHO2_12_FULL_63_12]
MSSYKPNAAEAAWIRELAAILDQTGLTEIEIEKSDVRVRVARTVAAGPAVAYAAAAPAQGARALEPQSSAAPSPASEAPPADAVTSPMVGTIYLSPSPGADPFVKAGDNVAQGQTLMIVEAMKTMNPISAPKAGKVRQILVRDAQPVEFGEPLIVID